jgi:dienelactone hydrolase
VPLLTARKIFGKKDNHVPPAGRDLIRKTLHDAGVCFSFYEVSHAQREWPPWLLRPDSYVSPDAFIRDELSKGRYDPAIAGICFQMLLELFSRTLRSDLGPPAGQSEPENAC